MSLIIANRYPGKERSRRPASSGWDGLLPLHRLVTGMTTHHIGLLIRRRMVFIRSRFFLNGTVKLLPQCRQALPKTRVIGRWRRSSSHEINRGLGTRPIGINGRCSLVWINVVNSEVGDDIKRVESNEKGTPEQPAHAEIQSMLALKKDLVTGYFWRRHI